MKTVNFSDVTCIVFDIDDTLFLEENYISSGLKSVDEYINCKFNTEGFFSESWSIFKSGNRAKIFDDALKILQIKKTRSLIKDMLNIYRNHNPKISIFDDAKKALEIAKSRYSTAIISDGILESQSKKVSALNLNEWVTNIVLTGSWGKKYYKPHVKAFNRVEQLTSSSGNRCLYVADNPTKDFIAPKLLGWNTLRVRRKEGLYFSFPSGDDVDLEVNNFYEFLGRLTHDKFQF